MRPLRYIGAALALILIVVSAVGTRPAVAAADPATFIKNLGESALAQLQTDTSAQEREAYFRKLFVENFDVPAIGRFVLGRYWNSATPAQRDEFLKLFEDLIVQYYSGRFSEYSGEQLQVGEVRSDRPGFSTVHSSVVLPRSSETVRVDWRVREEDGQLKIVDVMVEGVSMAVTQRAEFASVIQSRGGKLDGLLEALRAKTTGASTTQ
jgi:phospholipid transport system substrate-binding protein